MSYLSYIARLFKNLRDALHLSHLACKLAVRINAEIQDSNASDGIKAQAAAFLGYANALCEAIETYKNNLPGEAP